MAQEMFAGPPRLQRHQATGLPDHDQTRDQPEAGAEEDQLMNRVVGDLPLDQYFHDRKQEKPDHHMNRAQDVMPRRYRG
jgi:hypothetical protein